MSLSLEVRKFINSEHTGDFVSVVLPSELPVERAEVREVNKDKSAANSARIVADNKSRLAAKAKNKAEHTLRARNNKQDQYDEASRLLASLKNKRDGIKPDLDRKREEYEQAHAVFEEKREIYMRAAANYAAAEKAYAAAADAETAAILAVNECRAQKSGAEAALASAKEGGIRNEGALSSARSEAEQAQVRYENAQTVYQQAAAAEAVKDEEYTALANAVAQLLAIQKDQTKRASDCMKALASADKELSRAAADYSSASEAVASAERLLNDNEKYDTEAQRAKINTLRQKQAAAKTRRENARKNRDAADAEAKTSDEARSVADINYNKENEKLLRCKAELDELRSKTQEASMKASEAKALYTSLNSGYEQSQGAAQSSAQDVVDRQQDVVEAEKALLNAESDAKAKHEKLTTIKGEFEKIKSDHDEKAAVSQKCEEENNSRQRAFEEALSLYEAAERELEDQHELCNSLNGELELLDRQLDADRKASSAAADIAAEMEEEAERLRLSVRTISTRYETANIHFMQQGRGEDIILIHSVGQSLYTFRELISKLSGNFRVTALDLVGFGYSDKPFYFDYTMDEMADFIDRFMSEMGIQTANFYGFSMGAGYVVNFAKRYPERVERLILMSPGGITPEMPLSVRMLQSRLFGGMAAKLYNLKTVDKLLNECFFDLTNLTDDLLTEYYRPASLPDCRRVVRTCIANYDDEGVLNSLRDIGAETLLLWGNEDKWHPTEMADIFRNVLPNVTYYPVRNAGHLAHEEKAEKVAYLIKCFIPCGFEE